MGEWLSEHAWHYHYEVIVRRQGREQIVSRVPSQRRAEQQIAHVRADFEISRPTVYWRRVRGVHPANLAKCCFGLLVLALLLPWVWPRLVVSLLCTSLICGALSSGSSWKQGGDDDR